jgi:hypothetical protein
VTRGSTHSVGTTDAFRATENLPRHGEGRYMIAMSLRSLPRASIGRRGYNGRLGSTQAAQVGKMTGYAQVGRLMQKRWASDDKKGPDEKPFYHQLQESIYERVQREKAEQIRIQSLQQRTARGQFWATVTGTHLSLYHYTYHSYNMLILTPTSMCPHSSNRLLLGPNDPPKSQHLLHRTPRRLRATTTQHLRSEYGSCMDGFPRHCRKGKHQPRHPRARIAFWLFVV